MKRQQRIKLITISSDNQLWTIKKILTKHIYIFMKVNKVKRSISAARFLYQDHTNQIIQQFDFVSSFDIYIYTYI